MGPKKAAHAATTSSRTKSHASTARSPQRADTSPTRPYARCWRSRPPRRCGSWTRRDCYHANGGMTFEAVKGDATVDSWVFSVGGGTIASPEMPYLTDDTVYPLNTIEEILNWAGREGKHLLMRDYDQPDLWEYLDYIWHMMCDHHDRGLNNDGVLPGGLKVARLYPLGQARGSTART